MKNFAILCKENEVPTSSVILALYTQIQKYLGVCAAPLASMKQENQLKTLSFGGVKLINEEVHHDYMEVRNAVEGK
jgi:hypothetical protein